MGLWQVAKLPSEVVQHIFALKEGPGCISEVLTIKDRVRCMAVCRAWRECLSPASWPLENLAIDWCEWEEPPAQWTLQTQPQTRSLTVEDESYVGPYQYLPQLRSYLSLPHPELQELTLYLCSEQVRGLWPAVCALPELTRLHLENRGCMCVMDGTLLAALPSTLKRLDIWFWSVAEIRWFKPLLPGLTKLVAVGLDRLEVDAPLPSLCELVALQVQEVDLAGTNLALPRLTRLGICSSGGLLNAPGRLKADFGHMPQLASLGIDWVELAAPTASSFASLAHLTRLAAKCSDGASEAAALNMLRQAPTTLRSLHAIGCSGSGGDVACALRHITGLASLTGDSTAAVLQLLGSTHALRELEVRLQSDGGYGLQLSALTQLTKLTADKPAINPHLAPLCNLRELCFSHVQPAQLTVEQLRSLMAVPSLRRLHFNRDVTSDSLPWCLEVFRAALPSCKVMQSDLFEHEYF